MYIKKMQKQKTKSVFGTSSPRSTAKRTLSGKVAAIGPCKRTHSSENTQTAHNLVRKHAARGPCKGTHSSKETHSRNGDLGAMQCV